MFFTSTTFLLFYLSKITDRLDSRLLLNFVSDIFLAMPLDRRQLVHRTIQKALGKTDEEIMTSYIELYSGKKNKVTSMYII